VEYTQSGYCGQSVTGRFQEPSAVACCVPAHRRDIPALCREFADYTAEAEDSVLSMFILGSHIAISNQPVQPDLSSTPRSLCSILICCHPCLIIDMPLFKSH